MAVFKFKAAIVVGEIPRSIAAGDFNNDGFADLLVDSEGDSELTVLLNQIPNHDILGGVNRDFEVSLLDVAPFVSILAEAGFQIHGDTNLGRISQLVGCRTFVDVLPDD